MSTSPIANVNGVEGAVFAPAAATNARAGNAPAVSGGNATASDGSIAVDPVPGSADAASVAGGRNASDHQTEAGSSNASHPVKQQSASNGLQFVYVYDDQLHRNVVKIRDIETQKLSADLPPGSLLAQAQFQVPGAAASTSGSSLTSGSVNGVPGDQALGSGTTGNWIDTTA